MGRPPIGKYPMTGAERQRKFLAKLKGNVTNNSNNVNDSTLKELEELKELVTQLNTEKEELLIKIKELENN